MTIKLFEYISKIEKNELCLPDFQREFVWGSEKIKGLVSAVFAKLPLASILVIENTPSKEYGLRKLGLKETFLLEKNTDLLVDGQQRLTALTQVFSDKIFEFAEKDASKLSNQSSLKECYFLDLTNDIFGLEELDFKNPDEHLSTDYLEAISAERWMQKSEFYPGNEVQERIQYATNKKLLPLFLFGQKFSKVRNAIEIIAKTHHASNPDIEKEEFREKIINWSESVYDYLQECIKELNINVVTYPYSDRAKAVDAYESLNIGGVKLDTFDILVARVTHRTQGNNFVNMLWENIDDTTKAFFQMDKDSNVNNKYKDKFKKLLTYFVKEKYSDKDSLNLTSNEIYDNYKRVQNVISKTTEFFHSHFGTQKYTDIPYYLMYDLVASLVIKDKLDANLVKAWYWISLFSNSYDNNQNKQFADDLKVLLGDGEGAKQKLCDRKCDYLFKARYTISHLMGKEENKPSDKDRNIIEQYYLSKGYMHLLKKNQGKIDIDTNNLQSNHTIPKAILERLGIDDAMIESPLNRALITADENNYIKTAIPRKWKYDTDEINPSIKAELGFDMSQEKFNNQEDYEKFLEERFRNLEGKVNTDLSGLLGICEHN